MSGNKAPRGARTALFVSTDLSAPNAGAVHVLSLARAFAALGCDTVLVAPCPPEDKPLAINLNEPQAHVCLVRAVWRGWLPNSLNFLLQIPALIRVSVQHRPDMIYVRSGVCSFVILALARWLSPARVVSEHNGWTADEAKALGYRRWQCRLAAASQLLDARIAHRVRVVTSGLAELLVERGIDRTKIDVIGNGTDVSHFKPRDRSACLRELGLDPSRSYAGFIGNLVPWQGVDLAIRAHAGLAQQLPALDLIIAGDGPERENLERLATELESRHRVHFLGEIPYACAPSAIAAMDLALAPFVAARNRRIGLSPLKIRDYAACGKTVLCANIGGLTELTREDWCHVHRADDVQDLAERMVGLMADERALRDNSGKARDYALAHFDWGYSASAVLEAGLRPQFNKSGD